MDHIWPFGMNHTGVNNTGSGCESNPEPNARSGFIPKLMLKKVCSHQELFGTGGDVRHQSAYNSGAAPTSILDVISLHRTGGQAASKSGPIRAAIHMHPEEESSQDNYDVSPARLSVSVSPLHGSLATIGGGSPEPTTVAGVAKSPESGSIASLDLEPAGEEQQRQSFFLLHTYG
jgi:hypothetical protein